MEYRRQFKHNTRFISVDSCEKHPLFLEVEPVSIKEMLRRSSLGIPLSVPVSLDDRIPINNFFFTDKFDVIDTAIRHDMKIAEDKKKDILKRQDEFRKEREEFLNWKKQQEQESLKKTLELAQ